MIDIRRQQRNFGDGFIQETVDELWEDWMRHADLILVAEQLLEIVYRALQRRHPRSGTHGRPGTPAEVVLRMLRSSTSAIGASLPWSAKSAATSCTASSRV